MKYLVVRIKDGLPEVIGCYEIENYAIQVCNMFNTIDATARYTVYEEAEV